jgi:hypothetical protein
VPLSRALHFLIELEEEQFEGEQPEITLEQIMGENRNYGEFIPCNEDPKNNFMKPIESLVLTQNYSKSYPQLLHLLEENPPVLNVMT